MTITKPITLQIHGALFDVDGTIIDSTEAIADFWFDFGKDKPYFNPQYVIDNSHGCRTFDVIKQYAPDFAIPEYVKNLESGIPDKYGSKAKDIKGSPDLVREILKLDGKQRVGIATSGTYQMATKWFGILGLEKPDVFITAESVTHGKPHPEPYLLGRKQLGLTGSNETVIVFEDAKAGVEAGKKAGCLVIGIASTHEVKDVIGFGADIVVEDLTTIKVTQYDTETNTFGLFISDYHFISKEVRKLVKHSS